MNVGLTGMPSEIGFSTLSGISMALSAPVALTETYTIQAKLPPGTRLSFGSNVFHATIRMNGMSELHNEKLRAALAWLGARYLCAVPQKRRVRK